MAMDMSTAIEHLDVRMARLEGAYEQINQRLANLERGLSDLRTQINTQFYWLLTLILGSILIPLLRDLIK